jgi:hypothetical protein
MRMGINDVGNPQAVFSDLFQNAIGFKSRVDQSACPGRAVPHQVTEGRHPGQSYLFYIQFIINHRLCPPPMARAGPAEAI